MWTVIGGLGGSLTAVGLLITFDTRNNYAWGLPVLAVGIGILALWYANHVRT